MRRGVLITFEGGEGAGKTTLLEEIARRLASEGIKVVKTREPGGTSLGEHIRALLLEHSSTHPLNAYSELCLFLASRAQHIEEVILPALQGGQVVLCDRFNDSTIAYQGGARGLGLAKVKQICDFICHGVQPLLTFYLDIDPAEGLFRANRNRSADRIESEGLEFHRKIREAFLTIRAQEPKRFSLIDASQPPAAVFSEAMKQIQQLLEKGGRDDF